MRRGDGDACGDAAALALALEDARMLLLRCWLGALSARGPLFLGLGGPLGALGADRADIAIGLSGASFSSSSCCSLRTLLLEARLLLSLLLFAAGEVEDFLSSTLRLLSGMNGNIFLKAMLIYEGKKERDINTTQYYPNEVERVL